MIAIFLLLSFLILGGVYILLRGERAHTRSYEIRRPPSVDPRQAAFPPINYRLKCALLSGPEATFFQSLEAATGTRLHLQYKARLADILEVDPSHDSQFLHYQLNSIVVDFVIVDAETHAPVAIIELAKNLLDTAEQESRLNQILEQLGIALVRFPEATSYDPTEIAAALREALPEGSAYSRQIRRPRSSKSLPEPVTASIPPSTPQLDLFGSGVPSPMAT
jgi:hypothetical protein